MTATIFDMAELEFGSRSERSVRPHPLTEPIALAGPLLILAAFAILAAPAQAEDLDRLLREWEIISRHVYDPGWQEQQKLLAKIADLDTPESREALRGLRDKQGRGWRRTGLILGAMLRNAGPEQVDEVIRWVEERRDPYLLEHLADSLVKVRDEDALAHLRGKALQRAKPVVKAQIARSRGLARDVDAVPALLRLLSEKFVRVRWEVLGALASIGDERAVTPILKLLKDKDPRIRDAAARSLGALHDVQAVASLLRALGDDDSRVIESAALSLGCLGDPAAVPVLLMHLEKSLQDDLRIADAVSTALEAVTGKTLGSDLEKWRAWWAKVRDKPWKRADPTQEAPADPADPAKGSASLSTRSSRLVFVLDVSRSMDRSWRLERAKKELLGVIETLPVTTRFTIITFSDGVGVWKRDLQCATKASKRKAVKFVEQIRTQNGSNTWEALRAAWRLEDPEVDTIVFLSDGHPSIGTLIEPDLILAELKTINRYRRVRIHCVALLGGEAPRDDHGRADDVPKSERFMRRLAEDHAGDFYLLR